MRAVSNVLAITALVVLRAVATLAQTTPAVDDAKLPRFEVASVKRHQTRDSRVSVVEQPNGAISMTNVPVRQLIVLAYQVQKYQIIGGSSWLETDRFDVNAKANRNLPDAPGSGPSPLQLMLRDLLADRFKMKSHRETREMPVYDLVTSRIDGLLGSQLRPSTADCSQPADPRGPVAPSGQGDPLDGLRCGLSARVGRIGGKGLPLAQLATVLSDSIGRTVIDRSGLPGRYDFLLDYTPDPIAGASSTKPATVNGAPTDESHPSIFVALQEQLGLRLAPARGAVDVVVIDHIESPDPD